MVSPLFQSVELETKFDLLRVMINRGQSSILKVNPPSNRKCLSNRVNVYPILLVFHFEGGFQFVHC